MNIIFILIRITCVPMREAHGAKPNVLCILCKRACVISDHVGVTNIAEKYRSEPGVEPRVFRLTYERFTNWIIQIVYISAM